MGKINVAPDTFVYPMPVTVVGTMINGHPNFMAAAWVTRVSDTPPLAAVVISRSHATGEGIKKHGTFSINVPGIDLLDTTDYCGLVSGKRVDKSQVFEVFYGELKTAPLVTACPLGLECRLINTVELPKNDLFIGEIIAAYAGDQYLTDGNPDIEKMKPFVLTMPDNRYWAIGECVGRAWHDGKKLRT